ncbi:vitelline membrane outer layer protein 1-like [Clarias gariepinus]
MDDSSSMTMTQNITTKATKEWLKKKLIKVEEALGHGDDTALNGIALLCSRPELGTLSYITVQSDVGSWGTWTQNIWCRGGVLKSFQLLVEGWQGVGDDTAANNIRFRCSSEEIITGNGMSWGEWGRWSASCDGTAICGIQTRVEPPQDPGDNTSLNDVQFYCCY